MVAIELSLYSPPSSQSVYNHGYSKLTYYVNLAVELAIDRQRGGPLSFSLPRKKIGT